MECHLSNVCYKLFLFHPQAAEIQQQTVAMKDAPTECVKDKESEDWWDAATSVFSSMFTFEKDKCQKYYEHMLIDPFLKVPPTKVQ